MEEVVAIIAITFTFSTFFGIIYVFLSTRNKERMALIEKGESASLFNQNKEDSGKSSLRRGMVFTAVGLGIITGFFLETYAGMEAPVPYFAMIFLFGGLALVLFYALTSKKDEHKNVE